MGETVLKLAKVPKCSCPPKREATSHNSEKESFLKLTLNLKKGFTKSLEGAKETVGPRADLGSSTWVGVSPKASPGWELPYPSGLTVSPVQGCQQEQNQRVSLDDGQ